MDGLTEAEVLEQVIVFAVERSGKRDITPGMAVDHDLGMAGGDVEDFAEALAGRFGDDVWAWPWHRFACISEGLSPLFPFQLFWQLFIWPIRGSFSGPSPYERLELQHIAKVLVQGHWTDP